MSRWSANYFAVLRALVLGVSAAGGAGIVAMMTVTCVDIALRMLGRPLVGTFDIVRIAGTLAIACALPYTTAVKGHVAIEYFFHKLPRRARIAVDSVTGIAGMALFGLLARHAARLGFSLKAAGEVSATLRVPVFWLPWVLSFCCALVALVILHNLLHPGKELIKP